MKSGNRYPKWKIVLSSPVSIFIFLIFTILLVRAVLSVGDKVKIIDKKLDNANSEYSKLVSREKALREKVDFLSTDVGVETELRSKYKAVADGEMVAVILEDKVDASSTASTTANKGWFGRLFGR